MLKVLSYDCSRQLFISMSYLFWTSNIALKKWPALWPVYGRMHRYLSMGIPFSLMYRIIIDNWSISIISGVESNTRKKIGFYLCYNLFWGWMDEMSLTSDELRCGLLQPVWDLDRRLIRRQLVSQFWYLDKWGVHHFAKILPEVLFDRKLGGHCTHDWFYMHQVPLAYTVIFSQWRVSNPGSPVSSLTFYRLSCHGPNKFCQILANYFEEFFVGRRGQIFSWPGFPYIAIWLVKRISNSDINVIQIIMTLYA